MCIIGYVPVGSELPESYIREMFHRNPDGAGLMWRTRNGIAIRKGFFDIEKLLAFWNRLPKNSEKALHCRIATAGKISKACCHPFPVVNDTFKMMSTNSKCYAAVMHNGVISYANPASMMDAEMSDSMIYTADVIYKLLPYVDDAVIRNVIERSIMGSRLLLMRQNAKTYLFGNWRKDAKTGCYFSNESYKPFHPYQPPKRLFDDEIDSLDNTLSFCKRAITMLGRKKEELIKKKGDETVD